MCKCRSHGTFPPIPLPRRSGIGHALKRHPFAGLVDSAELAKASSYPEGNFGRNQLLDGSISLSHLYPSQTNDLHADARSTLVSKHAETVRAGFHDRGEDVSTGVSKARAWATTTIRIGPRPKTIDGPALAVSRPYLALDGIYRPIRAAFPNNPTRRQRLVVRQGPGTTGLSHSTAPLSKGLGPSPPLRTLLQTTIRTPRVTDSQAGLFLVLSPLLRDTGSLVTEIGMGRGTMKRLHPSR
ncbi:hypothetical protein V6N13_081693 [Hibiscus sabdariffa]